MAHNSVVSRNKALCAAVLVMVLATPPLVGCGVTSCAQPVKIWPPIGNVGEAVEHINSRTCEILSVESGEDVFIRVGWEERGCWTAGAAKHDGYVAISVTKEECQMTEYFRTGLVMHEVLHALGHWHHDEYVGYGPHSVMEPVLGNAGWELLQHDIDWLMERYCADSDH